MDATEQALTALRWGLHPDDLTPAPRHHEHREGDTVPNRPWNCPRTSPHEPHTWHLPDPDTDGVSAYDCLGRQPEPAPLPPVEVGDTVLYWNTYEHPRAAIVTGTKASLQGEQHVPIPRHDDEVYLVRFSPLGYHEYRAGVREWPGTGSKAGHWTRKP
jgi:hypothetical protein